MATVQEFRCEVCGRDLIATSPEIEAVPNVPKTGDNGGAGNKAISY